MTEIVREEIEALCERDNCVGNGVRLAQAALQLLKLTDAEAAKIAELKAEKLQANHELNKADLRIRALESERDQLRKQVEEQFVAGMKHAAEIINLSNWKGGILSFMVRRQVHNQILSAASSLEQKEQG